MSLGAAARAQVQFPSEERPEVPELEVPGAPPAERILPPLPAPTPEEPERLSTALRVFVREIRITGNTVISDAELGEIAAPYTNREVTSEDVQALRQTLTLAYVERGYVNSGVVIPDQKVDDGVIELQIIEGRLTQLRVEGNERFRTGYLRRRIELGAGAPLRVGNLEKHLQLLQQDQRLRRVNAELGPGAARGEAALRVRVEEEFPYRARLEFSNRQSAAIGELRGGVFLAHENFTGNGDVLSADYAVTDGLHDIDARYQLPFTAWDTRLELRYRYSESEVVEDPFDVGDPESRTMTAGIGISHPLYRSLTSELRAGIRGEWRESVVWLFGESGGPGNSLDEIYGTEDGRSRVSVLRFPVEWTYRGRSQVLAARSTLSVGIDVLGATDHPAGMPDGQFVSWLGQLQVVRRFDRLWGIEGLLRLDIQLSDDPLLPMERFSVGGSWSVRGYRESELVRDNGVVGSLELRIPLLRMGGHLLQLAPFIDVGHAWNEERATPTPETIAGAGVGLRWQLRRWLQAEFYWAGELRGIPEPSDRSLQDRGIHFRISSRLF